jgi:hypothetical protein
LVGDRTLLTILFDDRTTVGMVRLYASETAKKLAEIYKEAMTREDRDPGLGEGYGTDAKKTLDKLFDCARSEVGAGRAAGRSRRGSRAARTVFRRDFRCAAPRKIEKIRAALQARHGSTMRLSSIDLRGIE